MKGKLASRHELKMQSSTPTPTNPTIPHKLIIQTHRHFNHRVGFGNKQPIEAHIEPDSRTIPSTTTTTIEGTRATADLQVIQAKLISSTQLV
jgi:hypothetical protein